MYRLCVHALLLSQEAERLVCADSIQPGIELRFLLKRVERLPGLNESILQNVVCIVVVDHDLAHVPVEAFLVLFYNNLEYAVALGRVLPEEGYKLSIGTLFVDSRQFDANLGKRFNYLRTTSR